MLPEHIREFGKTAKLIYVCVEKAQSATVNQICDALNISLLETLNVVKMLEEHGVLERITESSGHRVKISDDVIAM